MKLRVTISDVTTYTDGIFQGLVKKYPNIYFFETRAPTMDMDFIVEYGNRKLVSTFNDIYLKVGVIHGCYDFDPIHIKSRDLITVNREFGEKLIDIIDMRFRNKWQRLYQTFESEYNPIDNYSMSEQEKEENGETREIKNSGENGTTKSSRKEFNNDETTDLNTTATKTDTGTISNDNNNTQENLLYGFNNEAPSPQSKNVNNGQNTQTNDSSQNNTSIGKETYIAQNAEDFSEEENNNFNDKRNETGNKTRNREVIRKGNIGVTTTQQMILSEIELRKYDIYKQIYRDVINLISVPLVSAYWWKKLN